MKDLDFVPVHYTANKIRKEQQNETLSGACENLLASLTEGFK